MKFEMTDFLLLLLFFLALVVDSTFSHPDGELNLTRGAGKHGVIQMVRLSSRLVLLRLAPSLPLNLLSS